MNLTKASLISRKTINILLLTLSLYATFIVVRTPAAEFIRKLIPEKNPPLTIYGKLPALRFVSQRIEGDNIRYELNTPDGRLPGNLPDRMYVFKYKQSQFLYQAARNAQNHASVLGFTPSMLATDLKGDIFVWRDFRTNSVLTIDTISNILTLETPLSDKSAYFSRGTLNESSALSYATSVIKSINRYYTEGVRNEVKIGRFVGPRITDTDRQAQAEIARVDFFRNVGNYPVLGPDPRKGLIHLIVRSPSGAASPMNHPVIEAYVHEIDQTPEATYPLIPISQAWAAVSKGEGVVANVKPNSISSFEEYTPLRMTRILINNIYLAYYDDTEVQEYLQPVYVFQGNYLGQISSNNGEITIYYPAIRGDWTLPTQVPPQTTNQ